MDNQTVTNFKCPNCGAPLQYSPSAQEVTCAFCDSTFQVPVLEKLYEDQEANKIKSSGKNPDINWDGVDPGSEWAAGEEEQLQEYHCPSCGAVVVCDENTISTSCVYCGNPTVLNGRLSGSLKPDYIIPFKFEKKDAIAALKRYYKGKRLLPRAFTNKNHIEEIKGLYVPFWLFDATVDATMVYDATKQNVYQVAPNQVTETKHYRVERQGEIVFEKVPVDGSTKMPDAYMDAIEPYDYTELMPFARAYLPGFLAERYDVDAEESMKRASERLDNTTKGVFASSMDYETCTLTYSDIQLKEKNASYALLPVWMLSTTWQNQQYLFAMNGQTGRLIGDLPISKWQAAKWFTGITAIGIAALSFLMMFL